MARETILTKAFTSFVAALATTTLAVGAAAFGVAIPAAAASARTAVTHAAPAKLTGRVYSVKVRATTTDADPRRMQAAVNRGGQVAITYRWMDRVIISAHNYSDATALKLHKGDLVTLGGKLTGTYRVTGATTVRTGSSSAQVLKLGATVMMQTCVFGSTNSRVVGLKKSATR